MPNTDLDEKFLKPDVIKDLEFDLNLTVQILETMDIKVIMENLKKCFSKIILLG